jgi:hypothetical protein
MWPKIRDPLMLLSLVFLVFSLMLATIPEPDEEPDTPTPREQADQKAREVAYGVRHRVDAVRLMKEGDDEDALARLKQAAKFDPQGDKSPEAMKMRDDLLVRLGFVFEDPQWPPRAPSSAPVSSPSPSSDASTSPPPGTPSTTPSPSPSSRPR